MFLVWLLASEGAFLVFFAASIFFGPVPARTKFTTRGVYPARQELCKADFELLPAH
jgi:hypothetical protein